MFITPVYYEEFDLSKYLNSILMQTKDVYIYFICTPIYSSYLEEEKNQ